MPIQLDPEDSETTALLDYADFTDKYVLEIGCGDGRLTWRYADRAARVIAIDPDADRIATAIKDTPATLKDRVEFQVNSIEEFSLAKGLGTNGNSQLQPSQGLFDVVFMSWSLC
jgi:predicted RNA methylase